MPAAVGAVAGEEHRLQAQPPKLRDGDRRLRSQRLAQRQYAAHAPGPAYMDQAGPVGSRSGATRECGRNPPPQVGQPPPDPTTTGRPSAWPRMPRPGTARARSASAGRIRLASAAPTIARASGCSDDRSSPAASRNTSSTGTPSVSIAVRDVAPAVSVPVLSKAITRTPASASTPGRRGRDSPAAPAGRCRARWPGQRRDRPAGRPPPGPQARQQRLVERYRSRPEQHGDAREQQHGRDQRARDPIRQALRDSLAQCLSHGASDLCPATRRPRPVLRMTSAPS